MGRRSTLLLVAVVIAALGATLVFLYVRGVEAKADDAYTLVRVLGADKTIEAGESVEDAQQAGKFKLIEVVQENRLDDSVSSVDALAGEVALTTIYPGEQIIASRFGASGGQETITIPPRMMAISVQLTDPQRVAGYVVPGSKVAIFLSATPLDAEGQEDPRNDFTRLLFSGVQVIGVGSTTVLTSTTTSDSGEATTEELPSTILTLAVNQDQAEQIIFAQGHGELSLGLLNDESDVRSGSGVTGPDLFR